MSEQELAIGAGLAGLGAMMFIIWLGIAAIFVVSMWKLFTKAGQPGWAAIVPVYNSYVMIGPVCGMSIMWFIFMFVPLLNLAAALYIPIKLAEAFGKGVGFGIGILLLPIVFLPILAFGDSTWVGGGNETNSPMDTGAAL